MRPLRHDTLTLVTTCKGRLSHLQESLPRMVELRAHEVIVVDANCPDRCGDWVEEHWPTVTVLRDPEQEIFNLSRSRNIGARSVETDWIFFIDADILLTPAFTDWLTRAASHTGGLYFRAGLVDGSRDLNSWGSCIVPNRAFSLLGGYDTEFRGWGGEDDDLYMRLELLGLRSLSYPGDSVTPLSHSDKDRTKFHKIKDKNLQLGINSAYIRLKKMILVAHGQALDLPAAVKKNLMDQVETSLLQSREQSIELSLGTVELTKRRKMDLAMTIKVHVR